MVEVRNLKEEDAAPHTAAWILIQKTGGAFTVSGAAKGKTIDASFSPRGFDTAEKAIKASVAWADLLEIPVIYVREAGDG